MSFFDGGGFTSTLSASEFALLSELGPEPIAQVLGTSVYQVGWQYLPPAAQWNNDLFHYLETVSDAWNEARRGALDRLRDEASSLGADAVVGVTLRRGKGDWMRRTVDFLASGTAIRLSGSTRGSGQDPALSNLSVQDYWKLIHGGSSPAGVVAASAVCFVSQGLARRWRRRMSVTRNQELIEFSDGFSATRHAALTEIRGQARIVGARGVVGASFEYEIDRAKIAIRAAGTLSTSASVDTIATLTSSGVMMPWSGSAIKRAGVVFTVHLVGTAIRRNQPGDLPAPEMILRLGATT